MRQVPDGGGHAVGCERAGRNDADAVARDLLDLFSDDPDIRVALQGLGDPLSELVTIHGQRRSRRHPDFIRHPDYQRIQATHLLFEDTGGVEHVTGAQGVRAHQFGQQTCLVGLRRLLRAHFVQRHARPPRRGLPGRLRSGQATTDDDDVFTHLLESPSISHCKDRVRKMSS